MRSCDVIVWLNLVKYYHLFMCDQKNASTKALIANNRVQINEKTLLGPYFWPFVVSEMVAGSWKHNMSLTIAFRCFT